MPATSFPAYFKRGLSELRKVRSLTELQKLYQQTEQRLFLTLYVQLVKKNIYRFSTKQPKVLFIDSTGNDGAGIGDAIFGLPTLDALGTISKLDVLTIQSRRVIFEGQENIISVFTDYDQVERGYDHILLLHPSLKKYKYALSHHGLKGLFSVLGSTYTSRFLSDKHVNHIELIHTGINDVIPLPSLSSYSPKMNLSSELKEWGSKILATYTGTQKICISVGCKEEKKNYKNLYQVIQLLAKSYPDYTFLLLGDTTGKQQENLIDKSMSSNLVFLSGELPLDKTFAIIEASDGIIGIDGGLTNAGIALGKETYMIFNIIHPDEIIPQDYDKITVNDVGCADKCYYMNESHLCHYTKSRTPLCLDNVHPVKLYNDIALWIDRTYSI